MDLVCGICKQPGRRCEAIQCRTCENFCHYQCVNIRSREEGLLREPFFTCPPCFQRYASRDLNQSSSNDGSDGSGSSGNSASDGNASGHTTDNRANDETTGSGVANVAAADNEGEATLAHLAAQVNTLMLDLQRSRQMINDLVQENDELRRSIATAAVPPPIEPSQPALARSTEGRSRTGADCGNGSPMIPIVPSNPDSYGGARDGIANTPVHQTPGASQPRELLPRPLSAALVPIQQASRDATGGDPFEPHYGSSNVMSRGHEPHNHARRPSFVPATPDAQAPRFNQPADATHAPRTVTTEAQRSNNFAPAAASSSQTRFGATYLPEQLSSYPRASQLPLPRDEARPYAMMAYRQTRMEPLPRFDGTAPEVWVSFLAVYKHLRSPSLGYSRDELIAEVSTAVQGTARRYIQTMLLNRSDPDAMIEELRRRYGDPHVVLGKIVHNIECSKPPRDQTKDRLLDFALLVHSLVVTARELDQEAYLKQPVLCDRIVDKLRDEHRDWWAGQRRYNPHVDLSALADYLLERASDPSAAAPPQMCRSRQGRCNLHGSSEVDAVCDDPPAFEGNTHQPSTSNARVAAKAAPTSGRSQSFAISCFYCSKGHLVKGCPDFRNLTPADRFQWVRKTKLCSCCLGSTLHTWKECPTTRQCGIDHCRSTHHRMLHVRQESVATPSTAATYSVKDEAPSEGNAMVHESIATTLFKIIPVLIKANSGEEMKVFALLDPGSNRTLMDQDLFDKLGLRGTKTLLKLKWTQGVETLDESYVTQVELKGLTCSKWRRLNDVNTVKNLSLPTQTIDVDELKSAYKHLDGLPLISYDSAKPTLLIGLQHAFLCEGRRLRSGANDQPIATKTPLGWVVFGNASVIHGPAVVAHSHVHSARGVEAVEDQLKRFITMDSLGVSSTAEPLESIDEQRAKSLAKQTLEYIGGRYRIGLLWKSDDLKLPDNYHSALKRLTSLERSLAKQPALLNWMNSRIQEMLAKGYVRKATPEELQEAHPRTWYLPTFVIVNRNKDPPKPRMVFDAAAKCRGASLNSNLLVGPDLVTSLISNACHFRESKYVVAADVQEMYHQVGILPEDQHSQRFLWRDADSSKPPTIYILQVMAFGTAPSSFSAQYVKNQHAAKYERRHPRACKAIVDYMYVDDYLDSFNDLEDAVGTSLTVIQILNEAGFTLRGFQSNAVDILRQLPQDRIKADLVELDFDGEASRVTKILGTCWDPVSDVITFRLNRDAMTASTRDVTKRDVLSTVMRIFDPIGHVAHILVRGKVILQKIWKTGCDWDQPIDPTLALEWEEWMTQIQRLDQLAIPRHYAPVQLDESDVELHVFCDASEEAYAATAYLRVTNQGTTYVAHVMAKTKVMPVRPITMPRAELNGAVMAVRLAQTAAESHSFPISKTTFWTDSKCVLAWINSSDMKFKPYVRFRIGEILEGSTQAQWRYVPSALNVADDATKAKDDALDHGSRWFKGPDFLLEDAGQWPSSSTPPSEARNDDEVFVSVIVDEVAPSDQPSFPLLDDIKPELRHDWQSLRRIVAYRLRFIQLKIFKRVPAQSFLTPEGLHEAEVYIYRSVQAKHFSKEVAALKKGVNVTKTSKLYIYSPVMDDSGLIRMRSRLQNASMSYAAKNPIILPNDDEIVDALIRHHHQMCFHQGEGTVIGSLRLTTWVLRIKVAVRRVQRNCALCKLIYATPSPTRIGDIPFCRLDYGKRPFTHVGVDVCGPFFVMNRRLREKRWVMIFTCMVTRAVHFEILEDLSTDRCVAAVQDFKNVRGGPKHLYSDCGTNFEGAANLYHREFRKLLPTLTSEAAKRFELTWHFNPARTPHWGGAWERLIRTFKNCLKAVMAQSPRLFNPQTLRTAMLEVMNRMNDRPLTAIPLDAEDESPLTPNDFLMQTKNPTSYPGEISKDDVCSRSMFRRAMHLANELWARWVRDYMPMIARAEKWLEDTTQLKVGEVVLLAYPSDPRETWRRGVIEAIHPGNDGRVRKATVREASGKRKIRSINTLARLGIVSQSDGSIDQGDDVVAINEDHPSGTPVHNDAQRLTH